MYKVLENPVATVTCPPNFEVFEIPPLFQVFLSFLFSVNAGPLRDYGLGCDDRPFRGALVPPLHIDPHMRSMSVT